MTTANQTLYLRMLNLKKKTSHHMTILNMIIAIGNGIYCRIKSKKEEIEM